MGQAISESLPALYSIILWQGDTSGWGCIFRSSFLATKSHRGKNSETGGENPVTWNVLNLTKKIVQKRAVGRHGRVVKGWAGWPKRLFSLKLPTQSHDITWLVFNSSHWCNRCCKQSYSFVNYSGNLNLVPTVIMPLNVLKYTLYVCFIAANTT